MDRYDTSIQDLHVMEEKHDVDANYEKLFFFRRHVVSCLLVSSDQIIQRNSPVQRSRCRDGVSFRFRIWRLYDLSWWNRRCHVLLINSQDVSLIRRDVLYTCGTICRLRSSDLSKDERRICAQPEVCNRWCYWKTCSFLFFRISRRTEFIWRNLLSLICEIKTVQLRILSRIPTNGSRNRSYV